LMRPTGIFFPGFTLTQGLTALIPAFIARGKDPYTWRLERNEDKQPKGGEFMSYVRLLVMFGATQLVTSVLLVSIFTSKVVRGTPLEWELGTRALAQLTHVPVYAFLAYAILKALSETELYKRLLLARK
jgi:hypothetical protein